MDELRKLRICRDCGFIASIDNFPSRRIGKDGHRGDCLQCYNKKQSNWAKLNKHKVKEYQKKCQEKRKEKGLPTTAVKWKADNPEKVKESNKRQRFKNHSITEEFYNNLLLIQKNKCALCRNAFTSEKVTYIDHNHNCCPKFGSCGKCVRGLLCLRCNTGLGKFDDSVDMLLLAVEYLKSRG